MEHRIAELEILFMQQEQTVEALSQQIYLQQLEIRKLAQEVSLLHERMKSMTPSIMASQADETPPPHY